MYVEDQLIAVRQSAVGPIASCPFCGWYMRPIWDSLGTRWWKCGVCNGTHNKPKE